eukprot:371156_1
MMTLTPQTDGFNNSELTTFALEIINDSSIVSDPTIDHVVDMNDAFICELAEEIEKEMMRYRIPDDNAKTSHPLTYKLTDHYTKTSNPSQNSHNQSIHTLGTDDSMVYLSYPDTTPAIVSRCQLSLNDSFNCTLPNIPSPVPKKKQINRFPNNKKDPIIAYTKRNRHNTPSKASKSYSPPRSPQRPTPPATRIEQQQIDPTASILSPRALTPPSQSVGK